MPKKIRWGVLGNAKIAREKVIPGMKKGEHCEVVAIASRNAEATKPVADALGVPKVYSAYEKLLEDPDVDAIYNPLPNDLHVPWSIKAAAAGKHVLCEKPLGLDAKQVEHLITARSLYDVKIGEAFMAKTHPQWLRAKAIVDSGELGDLRVMLCGFSYFNRDAANIRNKAEMGGGAIMDIGCYPITLSRMIFGQEPARVSASIERDPDFGTDRLSSAILEFPQGQCVFTCSTQLAPFQTVYLMGTKARLQIEIPFNAPPDRPTRIVIDSGKSLFGETARVEEIPTCDQYTIQGDLFSEAILNNTPVPVPLEDALANMTVIEALFRSAASAKWEPVCA